MPSEWTVDTLREHLLAVIAANDRRYEVQAIDQQKAVSAALEAAKEAVIKAENYADRRFESTNEWRKTVEDITANSMPRPEALALNKGIEEKLATFTAMVNDSRSQSRGVGTGWGYAVGAVGLFAVIVSLVLRFIH